MTNDSKKETEMRQQLMIALCVALVVVRGGRNPGVGLHSVGLDVIRGVVRLGEVFGDRLDGPWLVVGGIGHRVGGGLLRV